MDVGISQAATLSQFNPINPTASLKSILSNWQTESSKVPLGFFEKNHHHYKLCDKLDTLNAFDIEWRNGKTLL